MARALLLVLLVSACAGAPEPPRPAGKPQAPVDVVLEARALGGDRFEVTLEGRAAADLDALGLELALPGDVAVVRGARVARGERTVRGGSRRLVAELRAAPGTEVRGVAHTPFGPRAVKVRLGAPPAPRTIAPADRVVITPFGPVAEAR